ncbi:hypothetical protein AVEN_70920-1, partial [Araneus ventricosus]
MLAINSMCSAKSIRPLGSISTKDSAFQHVSGRRQPQTTPEDRFLAQRTRKLEPAAS